MLFQVLCGFEPIFYTTHPNEEPKNKNIKFGYGMQYAVLHTYNGGRNNNY